MIGRGPPGEFDHHPPRADKKGEGPIDRTVPKILEVLSPEQRPSGKK